MYIAVEVFVVSHLSVAMPIAMKLSHPRKTFSIQYLVLGSRREVPI